MSRAPGVFIKNLTEEELMYYRQSRSGRDPLEYETHDKAESRIRISCFCLTRGAFKWISLKVFRLRWRFDGHQNKSRLFGYEMGVS